MSETRLREDPIDTGLLDWVERPFPDRSLRFLQDDGTWRPHPYPELAARVRAVAGRLLACGLERGQVVVVVHRTGPDFVASFFGAIYAGGTVSPLAPPTALGGGEEWTRHAAHVIDAASASLVLADEDLADAAAEAAGRAGRRCPVIVPDDGTRDAVERPRPPAEIALLQFTSGSRGPTRGVRVSRENLEANISMIGRWIRSGDIGGASWLPLYHDMGLVGGLLVPVTTQMEHGLARPEQFIQTPLRWLAEFGSGNGEIMVMPNFGFDYVTRRIRPDKLEGMDFSSVKVVITGAERVRPSSLLAFVRLLAPFGFDPCALQPAYGLAEATLAVSGVEYGRIPRIAAIAPGPLQIGDPVEVLRTGDLTEFDEEQGDSVLWHVSCGGPLHGTSIEVVDDLGDPLPESHVGEIAVEGPAVAAGYSREDHEASTRFEDRRLFTGDAGFILDGELYVLGRIGDSLQVRGRNLYVEDLEQALAEEGLFSWHRMAVVAGYLDDLPTVCLLSEAPVKGEEVLDVFASLIGPDVAVRVIKVPRRTIEVTSSGKPRRRRIWQKVLAGDLPGEVVAVAGPEPREPVGGTR
ncbi:AMP-binding protein [Actinocorallia sp. B10E7]|uniref:AMP-binding protein n=1 Tax=Actinocorallia sp. B10E7 TaxID=3153558 RepID=UPI00325F6C1E